MEEQILDDRPGLFSRIGRFFTKDEIEEQEAQEEQSSAPTPLALRGTARYTVTVRRGIASFEDAVAAAQGLKQGEQQVLNLAATSPNLRQKIVDFMHGVNFAKDGTWEELGEHVYLFAPACAYVEVAPASHNIAVNRN